MTDSEQITIPVSHGELFDKLSILRIKQEKLSNNKHVNSEFDILCPIAIKETEKLLTEIERYNLQSLVDRLDEINRKLWDVEEAWRNLVDPSMSKNSNWEQDFIQYGRLDIFLNDKRYVTKRSINELFQSRIQEQKSYSEDVLNRNS